MRNKSEYLSQKYLWYFREMIAFQIHGRVLLCMYPLFMYPLSTFFVTVKCFSHSNILSIKQSVYNKLQIEKRLCNLHFYLSLHLYLI